MPNYTVREDGTAANKAAAVDGDPTLVAECMNLSVFNGETFVAGDKIYCADDSAAGLDYRGYLTPQGSGSIGNYIEVLAYPGDTPVFKGSNIITGWTLHDTNVWKATVTADEPIMVFLDGVRGAKKALPANLAADQDWCWESDILYQYSATDPDTRYTSPGTESGSRRYVARFDGVDYVKFDGLTIMHSDWLGIYALNNSDWCIVSNCDVSWNFVGIKWAAHSDDGLIDSCHISYNSGDGIGTGAGEVNKLERLTVTGCEIHHQVFIDGVSNDGAGIKAFGMDNSILTKSTWHHNDSGAIRLDGGGAYHHHWGCRWNTISENLIYENGGDFDGQPGTIQQILLEFSYYNMIKHNMVYDNIDGGSNIGLSRSSHCTIMGNVTWGATDTSRSSIRTFFASGQDGTNFIVGNVVYGCSWGIELSGTIDVYLRNNIVAGSTGPDLRCNDATFVDIDSDYNCFNSNGVGLIKLGTTGYTLAQWQALTDGLGNPQDAHSIPDDPQFTDAENHDFTLKSNSPCIGIGEILGPPYNEMLLEGSTWPDGVLLGDPGDY